MSANAAHKRQSRSRSVVVLESNVFAEESQNDLEVDEQQFIEAQPKHDRFAQLLRMRNERRSTMTHTHELLMDDEEPAPNPASMPSVLMRRGSSSSSFAALPTSTQAIRRVMASIDEALEEQRNEALQREMEAKAAEQDPSRQVMSKVMHSSSMGMDLETSQIHGEVLQMIQRRSVSYQRRRSKAQVGLSRHHHPVAQRVLTHIDLALHHHIPIYEGSDNGIERWTKKVMNRGAPMIAPPDLMIPDEPITFEVALNDLDSKSKKKRAMQVKHQKDLADAVQVGAMASKTRLSLQDLYQAYDEHVIVVNNALTTLHAATELAGSEDVQLARLKERERRGFCYPLEDIKTLFYFPSKRDEEVEPPELGRIRTLQAAVRMVGSCGLLLSPLVSQFLTSRDPGSLCCGAFRDFPSPFEFQVVITPLQLYLNLDRMFRGVVSPLDVRKIVYVCCGRSQHELIMWGALYEHAMSKRRNRKLEQLQNGGKGGTGKKVKRKGFGTVTKKKSAPVEDTPFTLSDGSSSSESTDEDDEEERAELLDYSSFLMSDEMPPRLVSDLVNMEYPYHRIDKELHIMIANSRRRRSTYTLTSIHDAEPSKLDFATNQQQSFERWFYHAHIPMEDVRRRFLALLKVNGSERLLMEAYHSLLPKEDVDRFRTFDMNKSNGLVPPSETWIPKNITLTSLEGQENVYSAKMQNDRDAEAMSLFLARFREEFYSPLSRWIRERKQQSDDNGGGEAVLSRAKRSSAGDLLHDAVELPEAMRSAVQETMQPAWPAVEGWPEPHRGGYAVSKNASPAGKRPKKSSSKGADDRKKTVHLNPTPDLVSVMASSLLPASKNQDSGTHSSSDDEEEDDDDQPDPYAQWDPLVLYGGQGLYYEAFVRALEHCPTFCRATLGLLFRKARYFPDMD